jgi:hypothetical protein
VQYTPGAPFDGSSSYKQDYPAHPLEGRPPAQGTGYVPNSAPFEGSTTYRDTHKAHAIDPSAFTRGTGTRQYTPNGVPFDGASSYKQVGEWAQCGRGCVAVRSALRAAAHLSRPGPLSL